MLSQKESGSIVIPRALLPRLSKDIQTTLSTEVWNTLVKMVEANYAYNDTILRTYEEYPQNSFYFTLTTFGMVDSKGLIQEAAKMDALQEKLFFEKFLERIKSEVNQQKILDDLYEVSRSSLCRIDGYYKKLEQQGIIVPEYILSQARDSVQELYDMTKPHISQFQKDFEKYNTLTYNPKSEKPNYTSRLFDYVKLICDTKLEILKKIYVSKKDTLGIQDIETRKKISSADFMVPVGAALMAASTEEPSDLEIEREFFYFVSRTYEEANERFLASQKSSAVPVTSQATSTTTTSSSSSSSSANIETIASSASTNAQSNNKPAPNLNERANTVKDHFDLVETTNTVTSTTRTTTIPQTPWLPSTSNSNNESSFYYNQDKNYDEKKKYKAKTNNTSSETMTIENNEPAPNIELARKLENKKSVLEELFFNKSLKNVKIEEKDLHNMIRSIGGIVDNKREAVRRQVSYSNKVGLIPNTDCEKKTAKETTFKMHYHTQNQRFCSPEILSHYQDFFHRIGIAPYQLWPDQYQQQAHLDNKTTRKYGGSSSSY